MVQIILPLVKIKKKKSLPLRKVYFSLIGKKDINKIISDKYDQKITSIHMFCYSDFRPPNLWNEVRFLLQTNSYSSKTTFTGMISNYNDR